MSMRISSLAAASITALVAVVPAVAKTPPPTVVANVGIQVAKLGIASAGIDAATSKCMTKPCLAKGYAAFYTQARAVDSSLKTLWAAAGRSGPCASAAVQAGAGFDSLTGSYHRLETATLDNNKAAATAAYGEIQTKTPRLTSIISS